MRTVGKALRILDLFTEQSPVLGLSEIAATTGIDRATCHRMLKVMAQLGYASQSSETKKYSLGATVVRLARTWETVNSLSATLKLAVEDLVRETGETAHATVIAGWQLATVAVSEGTRLNRVYVPSGGRIAVHATASGLVCLAYAPPDFVERNLGDDLDAYTETTVTAPGALREIAAKVRGQGYCVADRSFDMEVVGTGAPVFGADAVAIGAVAVAVPSSRMTAALQRSTARAVVRAGYEATRSHGGIAPPDFLRAYARIND